MNNCKLSFSDYDSSGNKVAYGNANGEKLGGYTMTGLYKIMFDCACYAAKNHSSEIDYYQNLSKKFAERIMHDNNQVFCKDINMSDYLEKNWYDSLYLSANEYAIAQRITDRFFSEYNSFAESVKRQQFDIKRAENYLYAYLDLCTLIFTSDCIYQNEIRSLRIAEGILNIGLVKDDAGNKMKKIFGIYSPFTVFTLVRINRYLEELHEESGLPNGFSNEDDLDGRRYLFATYAIHAFSRFTTSNQKTFLVDYSRRNDRIICRDINAISTIDNIKPIRLFEKIAAFINNYMEEERWRISPVIRVSIFGFCSMQPKPQSGHCYSESELDDLVYEIFSWYEDISRLKPGMKQFELDLKYFLVSADNSTMDKDNNKENAFCIKLNREYTYETKRTNNDGGSESLNCHFKIIEMNINQYRKSVIKNIFNDSDLTFFLDCPWFATENFDLLAAGDFKSFGNWLSRIKLDDSLNQSFEDKPYNRQNAFSSLNDQLNRLASNNVTKYGKIVRVMKNYFLEWIQEEIKGYREKDLYKTVYIYSSSIRGVELSGYSNIPIIREEVYSNKKYSILRISTRNNKTIRPEEGARDAFIMIPMWNLIKYYDISFAFNGLKNYFSNHFWRFVKDSSIKKDRNASEKEKREYVERNIISILRGIIILTSFSKSKNGKRTVKIKIAVSQAIMDALPQTECFSPELNRELKAITTYLKRIIAEIIFKNTTGFGCRAIRESFATCLYNQADSIDDIFFHYEYLQKLKNKKLNDYSVRISAFCDSPEQWNNTKKTLKMHDYRRFKFDKFNEKRLYKKLIEQLDESRFSLVAINTLLDSAEITGPFVSSETALVNGKETHFRTFTSKEHIQMVLHYILEICQKNEYTNSNLYKNAIKIIENRR